MKAVRYLGPGQVIVDEVQRPVIGEGELLLRMRACGVCGTDVKTFLRGHPLIQPGSVLGHEIAGEVVESRHPKFAMGQRVAVGPYAPCGQCHACLGNHPSLCEALGTAFAEPGGFAEYLRVPSRLADLATLAVPDDLDYETATLTEPLACCVHGIEALRLPAGGSLLVVGDGPMGLMQAAIARVLGAGFVMLSGVTPHRLEAARLWADAVVDAGKDDLATFVRSRLPHGPDAVLVSVASVTALEQGVSLVAKGGVVNVFAGMPKGQTFQLDLQRVHYEEVRVIGTFGYGPSDFRQAMELLAGADLGLDRIITHRVGLGEVAAALEAASRQVGIKTVVVAPGD